MNIYTLKTIKIRSYEMGLYFRDGEFKGLLAEGRHWFVETLPPGRCAFWKNIARVKFVQEDCARPCSMWPARTS